MNDSNIVITSAVKGGRFVIMVRMEYKIAMMGLLMGSDSHYEKKSVNAMNTAHRNILNEIESIGAILSTARNEAGAVIQKNTSKAPWCC